MTRVLVLGAGLYHTRAIEILREDGFEVFAVDRDPNAPGRSASDRFEPLDIVDAKSIESFVRRNGISVLLPMNDFAVRTAARVAANLGLIGISPEAAERSCDKSLMREAWQREGVAQPDFVVAPHHAVNPEEIKKAVLSQGLPCIVKPTDCGGSGRGITVVMDEQDIDEAIERVSPFAENCGVIVEAFMSGLELTVEMIIDENGDGTVLAISDKEKPPIRTRVALSLNYSAKIEESVREQVSYLTVDAARALGVTVGMVHAEIIVTAEGPKLVELGARGGGGHVFHTLIEAVSGIRAPSLVAAVLSGSRPEIPEPLRRGGVYRFLNPQRGILKRMPDLSKARTMPGVLDVGMVAKPGDAVGVLENSLGRCGHVVTGAENREAAIDFADAAEAAIEIEVDRK